MLTELYRHGKNNASKQCCRDLNAFAISCEQDREREKDLKNDKRKLASACKQAYKPTKKSDGRRVTNKYAL